MYLELLNASISSLTVLNALDLWGWLEFWLSSWKVGFRLSWLWREASKLEVTTEKANKIKYKFLIFETLWVLFWWHDLGGLTQDCWMLFWLGTPGQLFSDCSDSPFHGFQQSLELAKTNIFNFIYLSGPCRIHHLLTTSTTHCLQERKRKEKKIGKKKKET